MKGRELEAARAAAAAAKERARRRDRRGRFKRASVLARLRRRA